MAKRKIKMADIVRKERPSRPAPFLAKDKKDKREKFQKEEKEVEALEKKIERFEKKEIDIFTKEEARRRKKLFIKKPKLKILLAASAFIVLIGSAVYAAIVFLPRAEIKIITEKSEWRYNDSVIAGKSIGGVDLAAAKIPAELFSQKKNNNLLFPATGRKNVERKASGKITIYNAYSSKSQRLVVKTRFLAPDGKLFYTTKGVTVPGAKVVEGKIVPSSIEVAVIAEKAGEEYNIGPVDYFSIPGFKGSPKYKGFYGESKEPMTGGFVGVVAVPTDEDIKKAKEKNREILQKSLASFVHSQIPADFKIIEGAEKFNVLKESVKEETDEAGNFSVFTEAEFSVLAFRENDARDLMVGLAKKDLGSQFELKEEQWFYGVGRADFDKGQISFPVNFQGVFWQPINIDEFRETVKNKREAELRAMVFTLPDVEKVTVSFWPFWVKKVPDKTEKIKVAIE